MPQYLRAFLFLSAACAVAAHLEVETVYLPECGPLALNPLFSEARTNTRSVHPGFLAAFERLARRVCGAALAIRNPFLYATKGEVAAHLAGAERAPLVSGSVSCWNWARVPRIAQQRGIAVKPGTRQCGECLPCLGRRAGLHAAGLEAVDAPYLIDVFHDLFAARVPRGRQTAILDYVRFCRRLLATPAAELLVAWPDLSVAVEGMDGEELRVIAPEVGGGFGAKLNVYAEEALLGWIAMQLGNPVKWIETRRENMNATIHGRGQTGDIEVGCKNDGTLTGLRYNVVADLGAYHQLLTPAIPTLTGLMLSGAYKIPAIQMNVTGVSQTNGDRRLSRRGRPEATYVVERVMDLVAAGAGY